MNTRAGFYALILLVGFLGALGLGFLDPAARRTLGGRNVISAAPLGTHEDGCEPSDNSGSGDNGGDDNGAENSSGSSGTVFVASIYGSPLSTHEDENSGGECPPEDGDNESEEPSCTSNGLPTEQLIIQVISVQLNASGTSFKITFRTFTNSSTATITGTAFFDIAASPGDINEQLVNQAKQVLLESCGIGFGKDVDVVLFGRATRD